MPHEGTDTDTDTGTGIDGAGSSPRPSGHGTRGGGGRRRRVPHGRAFYQACLNGFGPHGIVHLAQAAAARGCIPGVVTSPLVVVPFTLWARGRLRDAGVRTPTRPRDLTRGLGLAVAATAGAHVVARRIRRGAFVPPAGSAR
ncbi:HXXEE domain-containing protein [Streptomyces sp. NBC_00435]